MTDDLSISARVIVWVVCIPTLFPYGLISPCGLMDYPYLLRLRAERPLTQR
jgi:hypothetical protein